MMNEKELEEQLVDVRKSYRLLFDYQRHVMDLVKFIGNQLGYYSVEGFPVFSGPAPRYGKKNIFDLWIWDWLNMYHYEFNFGKRTIHYSEISFAIHIVSDTGYYTSDTIDKTAIDSFSDPTQAHTKLVFYASTGEYVWKKLHPEKDFSKDFSEDFETFENGKIMLGKAFDLKQFSNSKTTMDRIAEFRGFCLDKGVNI